MDQVIINYLSKRNIRTPNSNFYSLIDNWSEWYKGKNSFHKYKDSDGKERTMFSAGMAKQIAEDWASICFTERDIVTAKAVANGKEKIKISKASTSYLQKQLKDMNYFEQLTTAIEKCAALGTVGASLKIKNVELVDNELKATPKTTKSINYINAKQIVPLRVENGIIKDVAFVSKELINEKKIYYIEMHTEVYDEKLKKRRYKIENIYVDENGNEIENEKVIKEYYVDVPFFAILKTPINNPYDDEYEDIGFGMSIFSNAIDQLKSVDIMYHNFNMDFYLGGKKVFYNKKIVKTKVVQVKQKDGTVKEELRQIYPDDVTRQQFQLIGDGLDTNKEELIKEYNPELRVTDNTKGLQFALDLLSFKCGMGTGYYKIDKSGKIVTATEYVGDKKDLVDNANKFRAQVNKFIAIIGKAILFSGRTLFNAKVSEECEVELEDSDGFMIDTESAKRDFREEVSQGLRKEWEYRVRFFKESEDEAKKILEDDENTDMGKKKNDDEDEEE